MEMEAETGGRLHKPEKAKESGNHLELGERRAWLSPSSLQKEPAPPGSCLQTCGLQSCFRAASWWYFATAALGG